MKKYIGFLAIISIFLSSCFPHFHFDLLGKDELSEVVLIQSPARDKILLLDVTGIIGLEIEPGLLKREAGLASQIYTRLEKAARDEKIRGIILRLDSPGGEVTASDIIHHEILLFKEKTGFPVVGLTMGTAASGAYYIASACDYLISHPSTITGSIGVISIFPSTEELLAKVGVEVKVIKSGRMKDAGSPFRELTSEEEAVFQNIINEMYEKFLEIVLKGRQRKISEEKLRKIADGRILTAHQALEHGLIDQIGYFPDALEKILSLVSLKEADVVSYTYYPKKKTDIYASALEPNPFPPRSGLDDFLSSFKAGFYYLWLPKY